MKTLTKKNFIEFLVKNEACKPGLNWAKKQRRGRDIIEKCPDANYLHWLVLIIDGSLWAEYSKKVIPIQAEYYKKLNPLWSEYEEKSALLLNGHKKKKALLLAEFNKKVVIPLAKYNKECNILVREICTFERVQKEIGS